MTDYARIEKAILFIESHYRSRPSLDAIAQNVGLSKFHFQRLFLRWAGISPKRFIQYLTSGLAERLLLESRNLIDATFEAGLSSPGRLHDLMVAVHGVTPGEVKTEGAGLSIRFGVHPSPFGECFLAATEKGICALSFIDPSEFEKAVDDLKHRWRHARIQQKPDSTRPIAERIFNLTSHGMPGPLNLFVRGTNFQIKVWEALLKIAPGSVASYEEIAEAVGAPNAARAVGTAVSKNPVAYLIPCHRVIRKSGALGEYRWGAARKKAILEWEGARFHPSRQAQG